VLLLQTTQKPTFLAAGMTAIQLSTDPREAELQSQVFLPWLHRHFTASGYSSMQTFWALISKLLLHYKGLTCFKRNAVHLRVTHLYKHNMHLTSSSGAHTQSPVDTL
jgi:hypothetical protein